MERTNMEIRDIEKTTRGLRRMGTPILRGAQIYYNFIRPHMGLDGELPQMRLESKSRVRTDG